MFLSFDFQALWEWLVDGAGGKRLEPSFLFSYCTMIYPSCPDAFALSLSGKVWRECISRNQFPLSVLCASGSFHFTRHSIYNITHFPDSRWLILLQDIP